MSSFGEELRRERELRQINLREVAEATKISLRYLEALESNDFEDLPGGVFNRGFVRAYSQYIGIDPEAMVNAYLLEEQAQATQGRAADRHVLRRNPATAAKPAATSRPRMSRQPLWKWGLLLLVIAGIIGGIYVVILLSQTRDGGNDGGASRARPDTGNVVRSEVLDG